MAASPSLPREPEQMPHLRGEGPEFLALADAEAVVEGCTLPLHSHVLARASRVFAQLFTSLAESSRPAAPAVTDVTDLFSGVSLATALTTAFMLYNGDKASVSLAFEGNRWDADGSDWNPNIELSAELLQSVVGLADKLDARKLLHEVELACQRGHMLRKDLLGWLATGLRLHLPWLRDRALTEIVHTLQNTGMHTALQLLRDPRWKELDTSLLLLLIDGLTAHKFRPSANSFSLVAEQWKEMGDLTQAMAAASLDNVAPGAANAHAELEAAIAEQHVQAQADWHAAFAFAENGQEGFEEEFGEEQEDIAEDDGDDPLVDNW